MRLLSLLADRLRAALDGSVRAGLAPYVEERGALRAEVDALRLGITALSRDREALDRWLSRRAGPFTGDMTVHEAWARHPRLARPAPSAPMRPSRRPPSGIASHWRISLGN